jgi:ribosomal protein S6
VILASPLIFFHQGSYNNNSQETFQRNLNYVQIILRGRIIKTKKHKKWKTTADKEIHEKQMKGKEEHIT